MTAPAISRRSVRRMRLSAAAPRIAAWTVLALLALAGLRATIRPPSPPAARVPARSGDLAAEAYAQSFVRALLGASGDADALQQTLAAYLPSSLADGAPPVTPGSGTRAVRWTAAVRDEPRGAGGRTIAVEADTAAGVRYVEVPVDRADGFLFVAGYPALVGPPATTTGTDPPAEPDIADGALERVLQRALTHYLAGQASDLSADLSADAVVSPPAQPLRVRSFDSLTWAAPGRAAVALTAVDGDGTVWTLRYELGVVKRDRWYVTAVGLDPKGGKA